MPDHPLTWLIRSDRPHVSAMIAKGQERTPLGDRYCDIASALALIASMSLLYGTGARRRIEEIADQHRAASGGVSRSVRFALFLLFREREHERAARGA